MDKKNLLVLEDDEGLAKTLKSEFSDHGYAVTCVNSISNIPRKKFEFAIVDIRLRGEFGLDAIAIIKEFSPDSRIVVLSGYGSITTAVEAVKRGAVDYLTKPANFELIEKALLGTRTQTVTNYSVPSLSQIEHEYIDFMLTKNSGNISKTAKDLGLHRQSLQRKLKKYT